MLNAQLRTVKLILWSVIKLQLSRSLLIDVSQKNILANFSAVIFLFTKSGCYKLQREWDERGVICDMLTVHQCILLLGVYTKLCACVHMVSVCTLLLCTPALCVCGLCVDVDECGTSANNCRYACKNIVGSFVCVCPPGYEQIGPDTDMCQGLTACPLSHSTFFLSTYVCVYLSWWLLVFVHVLCK